jgi:hypothetical protein
MTLRITLANNTTVTFRDESLPSSSVIQESVNLHKLLEEATCGAVLLLKPLSMDSPTDSSAHPQISQLFDEYSVLFSEPQFLPPKKDCDHTIPLSKNCKPETLQTTTSSEECARRHCQGHVTKRHY